MNTITTTLVFASDNLAVVFEYLTSQDKHNVRTLSVSIKFISTLYGSGQKNSLKALSYFDYFVNMLLIMAKQVRHVYRYKFLQKSSIYCLYIRSRDLKLWLFSLKMWYSLIYCLLIVCAILSTDLWWKVYYLIFCAILSTDLWWRVYYWFKITLLLLVYICRRFDILLTR